MTVHKSRTRARSSASGPPPRAKGVTVLCPVCLAPIATDAKGRVTYHTDTAGHDCPMVGRVGPTWDEDSTRKAVPGRSLGLCEFCGWRPAQDMHHRKSRGVGGRWSPANILHLCRYCHRFVTDHPMWAHALGLVCKSTEDPAKMKVTRENGATFQPSDDIAMPIPKGRRR
jgi:HNH endonuclease